MSRHTFDPNCPDCRPTLYDQKTQEVIADTDPRMVAINSVWDVAPRPEQEAFHRVTCLNSRDPNDLQLSGVLMAKIEKAMIERAN